MQLLLKLQMQTHSKQVIITANTGELLLYSLPQNNLKSFYIGHQPYMLSAMDDTMHYIAYAESESQCLQVLKINDGKLAYSFETEVPINIGCVSDCGEHIILGNTHTGNLYLWSFPKFMDGEIITSLFDRESSV